MEIRLLNDIAAAEPYASAWNCMSRGVPFRRWEWLASWWKHYGTNRQLYLLLVMHEEQLVAVAPWYMETTTSRGRVLHMLGDGEVCSDYLSILSTPEWTDAATEAMAHWLTMAANVPAASSPSAAWDLLELRGLAATDPSTAALIAHLVECGNAVHREAGPNCWRIELPSDWDIYLKSMSKSHRKQIRRADSRAFETGKVQHRIISSLDPQFAMAWHTLIDLHQRRRLSLGEPGCFASSAFSGFLRDAVAAMLPAGLVELHLLESETGPIAAELHFLGNEVVYAYQAGIDPAATEDEPGRLMNIATLRRAMELGRRGFDFLRGDEPYKPHWRGEPHALLDLRVVPRKTSAQLRHGMWMASGTVKNWVRSGMQLTGMK